MRSEFYCPNCKRDILMAGDIHSVICCGRQISRKSFQASFYSLGEEMPELEAEQNLAEAAKDE